MINVNAHINLDFAIPFSSRWSKCETIGCSLLAQGCQRVDAACASGRDVGSEQCHHAKPLVGIEGTIDCPPKWVLVGLFERIEEKRWRGDQTLLKFFVGREGDKPNVARRQDDFVRILQSKLAMVVSLMRRVSTQSNQ